MTDRYAYVMLYSTRIPIAGWGSAALIAIAAAIVVALPEAQVLTSLGVLGGVVLGAALVIIRRGRCARIADCGLRIAD